MGKIFQKQIRILIWPIDADFAPNISHSFSNHFPSNFPALRSIFGVKVECIRRVFARVRSLYVAGTRHSSDVGLCDSERVLGTRAANSNATQRLVGVGGWRDVHRQLQRAAPPAVVWQGQGQGERTRWKFHIPGRRERTNERRYFCGGRRLA